MKFAYIYRPFWEGEEGFDPNVSDPETDYDPVLYISDSLEKARDMAVLMKEHNGGFIYEVEIIYDYDFNEPYAFVETRNGIPTLAHHENDYVENLDSDWMCSIVRI